MRWVGDGSERSIREAVAAAVPALADARLRSSTLVTSNPEWCAGTAILDEAFIVKFAWSEVAAIRVHREAAVLHALAEAAPDLPLPRIVGSSEDPVAFVTRLTAGEPLHFGRARMAEAERGSIATQLASFLARLHEPSLLDDVRTRVPTLIEPHPQDQTPALRSRLPRFLDRRRTGLILHWCDWVDAILSGSAGPRVLVHGDLHGFNQVWNRQPWTLLLVADFEVAGPHEPEYDLRYFPPMEPTTMFINSLTETYIALSGRSLDMNRVMAWHIRTALGDALWRSEAAIPLPGGCTPASYVDDIERKLRLLRIDLR